MAKKRTDQVTLKVWPQTKVLLKAAAAATNSPLVHILHQMALGRCESLGLDAGEILDAAGAGIDVAAGGPETAYILVRVNADGSLEVDEVPGRGRSREDVLADIRSRV